MIQQFRPMTDEQFIEVSGSFEFFLQAFADPDREDYWLCILGIYGPTAEHVFGYIEPRMVKADAVASEFTTLAPWKGWPDHRISGATAHSCAAAFMQMICPLVFKENPQFPDLRMIDRWVATHKDLLSPRVRKLDDEIDYSALVALAAQLRRERLLLLSEVSPAPPKIDLTPVQEAVFDSLTTEYQSAKDIAHISKVDAGQVRRELPNLERMNLVEHKSRAGYRRK